MKPSLKFKTKGPMPPFEKLVRERVQVEREYAALNSPKGFKLSAAAFLKEALHNARATEKDLRTLRAALDTGEQLEQTKAALRRMAVFIKSPNCSRPPSQISKLDFLLRPEGPEVIVQLASIKGTTPLLFALACAIAGEQAPDTFGTAESSRELDEKLLALAMRREELDKRIGENLGPSDQLYSDPDGQGRVRVTFKLSDGKVNVHPLNTAGERLAQFLMRQEAISGTA